MTMESEIRKILEQVCEAKTKLHEIILENEDINDDTSVISVEQAYNHMCVVEKHLESIFI